MQISQFSTGGAYDDDDGNDDDDEGGDNDDGNDGDDVQYDENDIELYEDMSVLPVSCVPCYESISHDHKVETQLTYFT